MFGGDVARKAAVMQVQGLVADGKAALLKVVDRIGKKGIVISSRPASMRLPRDGVSSGRPMPI